MNKRAKAITGGLLVLGVAGVVATVAAKRAPKATEVRIEAVENRDLVASVTASGQVRPHTKVDVAADISGRIVRLSVREGQEVKSGQFLLQIDPLQYEAAVQRAEASFAAAKAQAAQSKANFLQAKRSFERSEAVRKTNAQLVSDEQIEQLRTTVEVNEALVDAATHQVEQAAAAVRDARQALNKTTLYAPMTGKVTRLNVEQGETAVPGTFNKDAATLLTVSDMSTLETRVKVDETDVAHIKVGDSAQVQIDAFPDTTFIGKVTEISNSSVKKAAGTGTDQAVDYEVTIQLLNSPPDTRPDFSATAKIITDERKSVLAIPIIALTVRENEALKNTDTAGIGLGKAAPTKQVGKKDVEGVFIVGADNKVTFRPVRVGIAGEKYFEVLDGLKAGEKIVGGTYQAIRELKDGTLVRETKVVDPKKKPAAKT